MKKVFLLILAGSIMFTACKKDEIERTKQQSTKTSLWILSKSNVNINGILCDEYINTLTNQVVYYVSANQTKTVVFDKEYVIDPFGRAYCINSQVKNCAIVIINKERYIILKEGTSPRPL
ncbi:MAG: hypothetical protein N2449_00540 [Bacteroidales bacterium]|nr:hypothetical protein [Bacteroidales bacterium]